MQACAFFVQLALFASVAVGATLAGAQTNGLNALFGMGIDTQGEVLSVCTLTLNSRTRRVEAEMASYTFFGKAFPQFTDEHLGNDYVLHFYYSGGEPAGLNVALEIQRAMETWSSVQGSKYQARFVHAGADGCPSLSSMCGSSRNGRNEIGWLSLGDLSVLGVTFAVNGREADVVLNRDFDWATHPDGIAAHFDVQTAVLHEMGHVAGLGHSPEVEAVMFGFIPPDSSRRRLTIHDEAGLRALYPDDAALASQSTTTAQAVGDGNDTTTSAGTATTTVLVDASTSTLATTTMTMSTTPAATTVNYQCRWHRMPWQFEGCPPKMSRSQCQKECQACGMRHRWRRRDNNSGTACRRSCECKCANNGKMCHRYCQSKHRPKTDNVARSQPAFSPLCRRNCFCHAGGV